LPTHSPAQSSSPASAPSSESASHAPITAICFDLLTALLDSWTLWNRAAGSDEAGRRWRLHYLDLTYAAGNYRPYEELVHESAALAHMGQHAALTLLREWDTLEPWPEVPEVLRSLGARYAIGVVTNCSVALAARAVHRLGVPVTAWVAAEEAGAYKPDPRPYRMALDRLGVTPPAALFVAGSPFDIPGARGVGMEVVWHNRLALARPSHIASPRAEFPTLRDLERLLLSPDAPAPAPPGGPPR